MKTTLFTCTLLLLVIAGSAQSVKPCEDWVTDFIQVNPKMNDGSAIDKYVTTKLLDDASLKSKATCMIGLKIYVNCRGEYSYEKQPYRNNPALTAQCDNLLQQTESILNGVKTFLPGKIAGENKDFTFKIVVKVKHNGQPTAELLY